MSGFFVSNNLGTFSAEGKTPKVFNATMSGFTTGVPSNVDFKTLIQGLPVDVAGLDAGKNGWGYKSLEGKANGGNRPSSDDQVTSSQAEKYFQFSNGSASSVDQMILYSGDGFHFRPAPGTKAKFQFKYVSNAGNTTDKRQAPRYYTTNIKKETVSIPTAAQSASYPSITNYSFTAGTSSSSGYTRFTIEFDGDEPNNYWSIDMGSPQVSGITKSKFTTPNGVFENDEYPSDEKIDRVEIYLWSITKKPVVISGCKDDDANNTTPNATVDDGSCIYTTAQPTITINETDLKLGEPVVITWSHNNTDFTTVQVLEDNSVIHTSTDASSSYPHTPTTIGTKTYKIKTIWNKPGAADKFSINSPTVGVVTPTSYVTCTDPNRAKDSNGECAACNSNYYLDGGLCTTCADPNMNTDSNGRCTTCLSGYALHTDGSCQKAGCMTYADGLSAADDYNYDPDAVVNDSTMCQGAASDGGGNGGTPDVDCELSDWSDWSEWSTAGATDGVGVGPCGTRTRTRTVITDSSGNGAVCGALEEIETKDCSTGDVTTYTEDATQVTPPTTPSPVVPIIIGVAALGALALLIRR